MVNSDVDLSEPSELGGLKIAGANSQAGRTWPGGRVKYGFHRSCGNACKRAFRRAIQEIESQVPCVRFAQASSGGYIHVRADKRGCYSQVGYRGRQQDLNLARGCQITGIAIHEIFHALGMKHEQSRKDRGSYVAIRWDNLPRSKAHNFKINSAVHTGSTYDLLSIMHYGPKAFSTNGKLTIAPKKPAATNYMGQRQHASQYDIEQVCKFYNCASTCKPKVKNAKLIKQLAGVGSAVAPTTKRQCTCKADWKYKSYPKCISSANKGCCNPDNDSSGSWCFTTSKCNGRSWDYCVVPTRAPKTGRGCTCQRNWRNSGQTSSESTGHCFNPDNDAGGPWCIIEKSSCARGRSTNWDYCVPKNR